MREFPQLLLAKTKTLNFIDCNPDLINDTRILYSPKKYDDGSRPFELDVVWQPDGMMITRLFVVPKMQHKGIGCDIIDSLKEMSRQKGHMSIMLHEVLPEAVGYWKKRKFCIIGDTGIWWNINLRGSSA